MQEVDHLKHCGYCKNLTLWIYSSGRMRCSVCSWTTPVHNLSAVKADDSKLPLDLLDPLALEGIAAVLAFGTKKYAAHNWRGGFKWSRLIAALLRHTFAIMKGELLDPESNLPHVDHIGCCWMFLSNHMKSGIGENDLYFSGSQKSETGKV